MKNNHTIQFDDEMILSLVDAHELGVDFSDAVISAGITEKYLDEARAYWSLLVNQKRVVESLAPRETILDEILAHSATHTSSELLSHSAPSPYMKYVIAFAAPVAVAVLVVGAILRTSTPVSFSPKHLRESPSVVSMYEQDIASDPALAQTVEKLDAPSLAKARMQDTVLSPQARMMSAPPVENVELTSDPQQLFAMLQDAGVKESQSDVALDELYDARLSELDAIVINQEPILDTYVQTQ